MNKRIWAVALIVCVAAAALALTGCSVGEMKAQTNGIEIESVSQDYEGNLLLTLKNLRKNLETPLQSRINDQSVNGFPVWEFVEILDGESGLVRCGIPSYLYDADGTELETALSIDLRYGEKEFDKAVDGVKGYTASPGLSEKFSYQLKKTRPLADTFFRVVSPRPSETGGALPDKNSADVGLFGEYISDGVTDGTYDWFEYVAYFDAGGVMRIRKLIVNETAWTYALEAVPDGTFDYATATEDIQYYSSGYATLRFQPYGSNGIAKSEFAIWWDTSTVGMERDRMGLFLIVKGDETYRDTKFERQGLGGQGLLFDASIAD